MGFIKVRSYVFIIPKGSKENVFERKVFDGFS